MSTFVWLSKKRLVQKMLPEYHDWTSTSANTYAAVQELSEETSVSKL